MQEGYAQAHADFHKEIQDRFQDIKDGLSVETFEELLTAFKEGLADLQERFSI